MRWPGRKQFYKKSNTLVTFDTKLKSNYGAVNAQRLTICEEELESHWERAAKDHNDDGCSPCEYIPTFSLTPSEELSATRNIIYLW